MIRLFDGTALKERFKAGQTLADVRVWVDDTRTDGSHPYSFFQPVGRKTYGDGEEQQTLIELGLAPSASLVLKPAAGSVAAAYEGAAGAGAGASGPYALMQRGAASVAGAVSTFLGIGYTPPVRHERAPALTAAEVALVREAAAAAVQMRTTGSSSSSSGSEGDTQQITAPAGPSAATGTGTSSVAMSGFSTPRPGLSAVPSSVSVNRLASASSDGGRGTTIVGGGGLGMNVSASSSSSNLSNVRTIYTSAGTAGAGTGASTGTGSAAAGTAAGDDEEREKDEQRITYNGNQLGLEEYRDDEK